MARTGLGPWKIVLAKDSSSHPGWIMHKITWRDHNDSTSQSWWMSHQSWSNWSSSVVSISYFVFNSLPARGDLFSADNLCKQFGPRFRPDILSGLIWIQTVWHPGILKKSSIQRVKYGTMMITCEGIWKSKSWSKYTFSQICSFWPT